MKQRTAHELGKTKKSVFPLFFFRRVVYNGYNVFYYNLQISI